MFFSERFRKWDKELNGKKGVVYSIMREKSNKDIFKEIDESTNLNIANDTGNTALQVALIKGRRKIALKINRKRY